MKEFHVEDRLFIGILRAIGILTIALLVLIFLMLLTRSQPLLQTMGLQFFYISEWNPVTDEYGALAFIYGTVVSSLLALLIATPLSVGVALFLTDVVPGRTAKLVGFLVEMLAAVPSVVYGLWGIFVLAPWVREKIQIPVGGSLGEFPLFSGPPLGVGMLTAGMILAIMVTPTISTICREVFSAISRNQREAALALGSTRWEMMRIAVLKSSTTGILGAVTLGLGRAIGETMAVTMVIGNRNSISPSLFAPGQTMASLIANEYAEATTESHLSALAAIGLALMLVSLIINSFARLIVRGMTSKGSKG
ncbi:MAG: phosphate ABC transporter permease subunit PstC [Bdellovibrionales bacterium]